MFAAGGVAEDNKFTNTYQCTARANMPDYKFQTEDPAVKPPAFTGVCGVGGPYGVGGNVTRSPGVTVEEACKYGGLIPWVNQDTYINDFDYSGTVQETASLPSLIVIATTKLLGLTLVQLHIEYSPANFHPTHTTSISTPTRSNLLYPQVGKLS